MTLDEFIAENKISMTSHPVSTNPYMPDFDGDHWQCLLLCHKRSMSVYFSKGSGHNGVEPTLPEVLDCLASDYTEDSFGEWCEEWDYDSDSRKILRTYRTIMAQSRSLARVLGSVAFNQLVSGEVDRL